MRSRTTTSAFLNAASTSPPATVQWNATLFGMLGVQLRRAGFVAAFRIDDGRQRLVVDVDQVERVVRLRTASRRRRRRRRRRRSGRRPSRCADRCAIFRLPFGTSHAHGIGCSTPSVSAPVKTATTPAAAFAADVSIRVIRACPCGLRRIAAWTMPGQRDVVGVARRAGDQPRIFAAPDAGAEHAWRSSRWRSSPRLPQRAAALAPTRTMF